MNTERAFAVAALTSIAGSLWFATAYALGVSNPAIGLGIVMAASGLCIALAVWAKKIVAAEQIVERRHEGEPPELRVTIARPRVIGWLAAALGALGIAAIFPLSSLGGVAPAELNPSKWRSGKRVVGSDGRPVHRDDLNVDAVITVFPEGAVGDPASQAILLRVGAADIQDPQQAAVAPDGFAAFSKICTHAGCPVAIYRAQQRQLMCPCHQSLFDVLDGAKVLSGPADRPLPVLPLAFDADGMLRARGDFDAPVGPGYWQRG